MAKPKIFTETKRLILREIISSDEAGLFDLDSDPEVHRYLGNSPVKNIEEIRDVVRFIRQQYIDNGIGRWAIIEKSSGNFIGWAGLKLVKEETNGHINFYDLGYRLIRKYWNRGYATESAIASVKYGFEKLLLQDIYATADIKNSGSKKVLEKAGLKRIETFVSYREELDWYRISKNKQ